MKSSALHRYLSRALLLLALAMTSTAGEPTAIAAAASPAGSGLIPVTHHGAWEGPNRLWFQDPEPRRSDGSIQASASEVKYTWAFEGEIQSGTLALSGPPGALRGDWQDSWHAKDGFVLHGYQARGIIFLYTTWPTGQGPDWGWRIELDTHDPEHLTLRMFVVPAGMAEAPAHDLRGARLGD